MSDTCSSVNRKELAIGGLTYVVAVIISVYLLQHVKLGIWKIPVAGAPGFAGLLILRAYMRSFRKMDELQARIQLESMAFSFAATAMLTLTYGFLQNAGFPDVNWVWVWPVMGVLWGIGQFIAKRKYR